MKKKDITDLRKKNISELKKLADEKRVDIAKAKADIKAGSEKNLKKVVNFRQDLSQILTVAREKEIIKEAKKRQ